MQGGAPDLEQACEGVADAPAQSAWPTDPELMATEQGEIISIALDEEWIYFSVYFETYHAEIHRMSKAGGPVIALSTKELYPSTLLVDNAYLYWNDQHVLGGLKRMAKSAGSTPELLLESAPFQIAQDESFLYWSSLTQSKIGKTPKQGGPSITLVSDAIVPQGVSVYGDWVYWSSSQDGSIKRVKKSGGSVETIVSDAGLISGVTVDCHGVYWASPSAVWWRPEGSDQPSVVGPCYSCYASDLYLDRRYVYAASGGVSRWLRAGGPEEKFPVISGKIYPRSLAVDATHVYWSKPGSWMLHRMIK